MWTNDWRRNLVALLFGQMLSSAGFSFFMPLLPLYVQSLGAYGTTEAVQWAGAMNAAASLSMAAVQPYWGAMADRWGRKPMVLRSMVGGGLTTMLIGLSTTPEQLLVLYTLQGMVTGTLAASTALVAASMPRRHLGFALGLVQMAVFVGSTAGPLGGGLVADAFGFRASFFAAGALLILGSVVVSTLVQESFTPPPPDVRRKGLWAEGRSLMGIGMFPLLVAVIFLIQFGNTTMQPVISLFIVGLGGAEGAATSVGMVMGATGAMSAVSAFTIGRIGDRIGHRPILIACLAGAALAYLPQTAAQEVWQLLLLRMLLGVFLGGLMPSANALVAGLIPRERRGAAFGITASSSALSHSVGPIFGAGVATVSGLRAVFLATGAVYSLAFLWALIGFRNWKGSAQPPSVPPARPSGGS